MWASAALTESKSALSPVVLMYVVYILFEYYKAGEGHLSERGGFQQGLVALVNLNSSHKTIGNPPFLIKNKLVSCLTYIAYTVY